MHYKQKTVITFNWDDIIEALKGKYGLNYEDDWGPTSLVDSEGDALEDLNIGIQIEANDDFIEVLRHQNIIT